MTIHDFSQKNSLINQFISELRDSEIQKDRMRFRKNIERIGEILSYEMSKLLDYKPVDVATPLGKKQVNIPNCEIVLCSILRAGIPLHNGILNYFDQAENAFISAYRIQLEEPDTFKVEVDYLATPSLEGKTLVLVDPMLATGRTLENVLHALKEHRSEERRVGK